MTSYDVKPKPPFHLRLFKTDKHDSSLGDTKPKASFRWLNPRKAAKHLDCSKSFLDKDRTERTPKIPFSRLGRHIRYDVYDLDAFLESQKTGGDK